MVGTAVVFGWLANRRHKRTAAADTFATLELTNEESGGLRLSARLDNARTMIQI